MRWGVFPAFVWVRGGGGVVIRRSFERWWHRRVGVFNLSRFFDDEESVDLGSQTPPPPVELMEKL